MREAIQRSRSRGLQATRRPGSVAGRDEPRAAAIGLLALEPRIVFDAAGGATAEQFADQIAQQQAEIAVEAPQAEADPGQADTPDTIDYALVSSAAAGGRSEIAFIDAAVTDIGALISKLDPAIEIVLLDQSRDGVEQIAEALSGRTDIDAIHILSHGEAGELRLGNSQLNLSSISGQHADELSSIRSALSEDADILIYGCDVASGDAGAAFVTALATATGADIAASIDDTGHAARGGDWDLETRTGLIEADLIDAPEWNGLLAPFNISATSAPVVRDNTGAVATAVTGGDGVTRHITDVTKMVGATAVWQNAGFVGATAIDLRATVLSITDTNPNAGQDPTLNFAISNGDDASVRIENAEVRIRWDAFAAGTYNPATGTGIIAQGDVGFFIRDIDAQGHLYSAPGVMTYYNMTGIKPQESVRAEFDELFSYQAEAPGITHLTIGLNVDPDTGATVTNPADPSFGKITATNLVDTELAGSESGVKFNWNNVSSWEVTYRVAPPPGQLLFDAVPTNGVADGSLAGTSHGQRFFDHDGDGDLVFVSPQTVFMRQLDLDANNSTQTGTGYQTTFIENGSAVAVVDADVDITGLDTNVASATVTLTNAKPADQLLVNGSTAASGTVNGLAYTITSAGGAITVQLTGATTDPTVYETAINQITFSNTSDAPDAADRLIEVKFSNGTVDSNVALATIHVTPVNDPPSIDLDVTSTPPVPGVPDTISLSFSSPPVISNDGQTEAVNGAGNGETAVYANVGTVNGQAVDLRAVVVSRTGADVSFSVVGDDANITVPGTVGVEDNAVVRWEMVLAGTNTPITGDFSVLVTDLDQSNAFANRYERITLNTNELDSYVLNGTTDITATIAGGEITFSPADDDTGSPGVDPTNAVQLAFGGTSSFTVKYTRSFGGNFTLDGNFTGSFFTSPATVDTNPDFGGTFIEGGAPIAIADTDMAITDDGQIASATITLTNPQTDDQLNIPATLPAGISVDPASTSTNIILTGVATTADYDAAIKAITFENTSATPNDTVIRTIDVVVTDDAGAPTNTATSYINVIAVSFNEPPVGVNDTIPVTEDTPVTQNVLGNDTDSDGDPLTIASAAIDIDGDGNPDALTLGAPTAMVTSTGAAIGVITVAANGDVTFTPAQNYTGPVPSLTYTPNDGTVDGTPATVTFGPIVAVPEAPSGSDATITIPEDSTYTITVADFGFSDPDGDAFDHVELTTLPANGTLLLNGVPVSAGDEIPVADITSGLLTFVPAPNANGANYASFQFVVCDDSAPSLFTETFGAGTGRASFATAGLTGTTTYSYDGTDTIQDGDYALVSGIDPSLGNWWNTTDFATFDYSQTDHTGDPNGRFMVVNASFDAGEFYRQGVTITQGGDYQVSVALANGNSFTVKPNVTISILDASNAVVATVNTGDLPDYTSANNWQTYSLSATLAPGNYSFVLVNNAPGGFGNDLYVDDIVFAANPPSCDPTPNTMTFNVTPVNDDPVDGDETVNVTEDTPVTGSLITNTTDVDGGAPTIQDFAISGEAGPFALDTPILISGVGTLTVNTDGSYAFTPVADYDGPIPAVTYTVTDGNGGTDTSTLQLVMVPVNDPPVATDDGPITVVPGSTTNIAVLPNDSDVDGGALSVTGIIDPANPGVVIPIGGGNPSTVTLASGTTVTLLARRHAWTSSWRPATPTPRHSITRSPTATAATTPRPSRWPATPTATASPMPPTSTTTTTA